MLVPEDLSAICTRYWPPQNQPLQPPATPPAQDDISIVTGFFDIGRSDWKVRGGADSSPYRRTTDRYFEYFANLAKIKNQLVIFTQPDFAERILELRREAGLENKTVIFTIADLFETPEIAPAKKAIAQRMTDAFRYIVYRPDCPEYNEPNYVLLTRLKFSFVGTAINAGVIEAPQIAWIDFGYCRDNQRFDPAMPWQFDAQGKMNLFHLHPLDDTPLFHTIRTGDVYFIGGSIVGPKDAWLPFTREIDLSLTQLLACDLIDDEQTLMLMAWRRAPANYITRAIYPGDWFVVFRNFNSAKPVAPVTLPWKHGKAPTSLLEEWTEIGKRQLKKLKAAIQKWLNST